MKDYRALCKNNKFSPKPVKSGTLWLVWQTVLYLVILLYSPLIQAHAQTVQASLRCPKKPLNIHLYQSVLSRQIELGMDTASFSNIRVRVKLRQAGRTKNRTSVTGEDILKGLSISQDGLLSTLSGDLSYSTTCDYPFVVRVKIRATDIASGTRLSSSTESIITITSAGEFVAKAIRIVQPTQTPTATATATVTPS